MAIKDNNVLSLSNDTKVLPFYNSFEILLTDYAELAKRWGFKDYL